MFKTCFESVQRRQSSIVGIYVLSRSSLRKMTTKADRDILNSILNPLLPLGEGVFVDEECEIELNEENDDDNAISKQAKELERQGVIAAERGEIDKSIQTFTKAIEMAPLRGSGYNNRAQALRLRGDVQAAMVDLNNAVNLTGGRGKVACQAFCQRGLIHRLQGRNESALEDFRSASKLGNGFAKTMLIQMNPYAALCNQMLADVMNKLQNGMGINNNTEH